MPYKIKPKTLLGYSINLKELVKKRQRLIKTENGHRGITWFAIRGLLIQGKEDALIDSPLGGVASYSVESTERNNTNESTGLQVVVLD